jgi:hypothetical protein
MADTQEVALMTGPERNEQVATVEVPAFPNLPDLILHQGRYFIGGDIGYGQAPPAYHEVPPFEPECHRGQAQGGSSG